MFLIVSVLERLSTFDAFIKGVGKGRKEREVSPGETVRTALHKQSFTDHSFVVTLYKFPPVVPSPHVSSLMELYLLGLPSVAIVQHTDVTANFLLSAFQQ